jgi:bile acid:Na+ symporter, BASS family
MNNSIIVTTLLPMLVAAIMFGLGLTLKREDFVQVWRMPRAVIVGLVIKLIVIPLIAFGLCWIFQLGPQFSVGLIMLSAAPSSAVANVFSRLAKADVALSLCITAIDNVITAATLPLFVLIAFRVFMGESQNIGLQVSETVKIFFLILIPVLTGMYVQKRFPKQSVPLDKALRILSIVVLVVLVVGVFATNWKLITDHYQELTAVTLIFNVVSFGAGFFVARLCGLSMPQAKSVSIAMGISGTALVATVALTFLGEIIFAMPAAFFSLSMYILAGLSVPMFSRLK